MNKFYGKIPLLQLQTIQNLQTISSNRLLYPLYHHRSATLVIRGKSQTLKSRTTTSSKIGKKTNEVQLVIGDDGKPKILLVSAPAEHGNSLY